MDGRDKQQMLEVQEINDEISRTIRQHEKEAGAKLEAVDYGIDQALKELL